MCKYEFKPLSIDKANIKVTYKDNSFANYIVDLHDAYVQVHCSEFAEEFEAWRSSIFIHFRNIGDLAGDVIYISPH